MRKQPLVIAKASFDQLIGDGSIYIASGALVIDLTKVQVKLQTGSGTFVTFKNASQHEATKQWNLKEKLPGAAKLLEGDEARKMRLAQFFTEERLEALGASRQTITRVRNLIIANPQTSVLKGVFTVDQLVSRVTYANLLRVENVGRKTVNLMQDALKEVGLQLYKDHFLGPSY